MFGLFARKGPFDAHIKSAGKVVTVQAGDNLLKAALAAGIAWPHSCRVGSCGTCRARLVGGKIKPLVDFSYTLDDADLDAGMILACQTCLRSDIEVDVELDADALVTAAAAEVSGVITGYRYLTHDIVELQLQLDEPMPGYLAGQYAELMVSGVTKEPRNYSFACAPGNDSPRSVTFFIRQVPGGVLTTWLHEQDRSGTHVSLNGPFGSFYLRESEAPVLCVAGGSGLAPIKALLEQMASTMFQREVIFLFGARTQADLYCLEEMKDYERQSGGRFRFLPVLSAEPEDSDWTGTRGNVTDLIGKEVPEVERHHAYLCGPPPMVDAAIMVLNNAGVDSHHIHYDKFLDASHMPGGRDQA